MQFCTETYYSMYILFGQFRKQWNRITYESIVNIRHIDLINGSSIAIHRELYPCPERTRRARPSKRYPWLDHRRVRLVMFARGCIKITAAGRILQYR